MQVVSGALVRGGWLRWLRWVAQGFAVIRDDRQPYVAASVRGSDEPGDEIAPAPANAAFDLFYARHEQPLYGYLRRLLPTHEIAVEIAQEAFFRAWRQFDTISAYDRPEAWLYRVATNLAISALRKRAPLSFSAVFGRGRGGAHEEDSGSVEPGERLSAQVASPLDIERQAADRDAIDRALRALPARQRAALLLAAVQGFAADEIAAALGVSPANARQLLSRGRERFRRLYDER